MTIKIETKKIAGSGTKKFRDSGRAHHNISISLVTDDESELSELDDIDNVQYELHPTFKQRIRVAESRSNNFEIRIWTYGYFKIRAKLILFNGNVKSIEGFVKW